MDQQGNSQGSASFNLIPLSLHLLNKAIAAGSPFTIDGTTIDQVQVLGLATNFQEESNSLSMTLVDGKDSIVVTSYRKNPSGVPPPFAHYTYRPNEYAVVNGSINEFRGQVSINVSLVKNINTLAEVYLFKTQVLWSFMHRTNKMAAPQPTEPLLLRMEDPRELRTEMNALQQDVLNAVRQNTKDMSGIKFDNLARVLSSRWSIDDVRKTIDQLVECGHVFLDDDNSIVIC